MLIDNDNMDTIYSNVEDIHDWQEIPVNNFKSKRKLEDNSPSKSSQ